MQLRLLQGVVGLARRTLTRGFPDVSASPSSQQLSFTLGASLIVSVVLTPRFSFPDINFKGALFTFLFALSLTSPGYRDGFFATIIAFSVNRLRAPWLAIPLACRVP